ncbi:MAG: DUF3870 domain-containing protein [Thermoleophilia bacterium]
MTAHTTSNSCENVADGDSSANGRRRGATDIYVGYAKPPSHTASGHRYAVLSFVVEVDSESQEIVNAEVTVVTEVARAWLTRLLVGRNLVTDQEGIIRDLEEHYHSGTQKAILTAFRDLTAKHRVTVKQKTKTRK